MATGYDNRQGGRASFAFTPAAPVQTRDTASGQSRGAQVQGGNSQGGVERTTPITAPTDGGIPDFLDKMMQPYVERKQQEKFFEGFSAAQSGVALDEIHNSHSGIASIFGPDNYEQGAAYYTATKRVDDWQASMLADVDNLKKLDPAERGKLLTEKSREMLTGNPLADQVIQKSIMDKSGPLLNTVTKARYAWQQETAATAQAGAADSAATSLQALAVAQAGLSAPTDAESIALQQQHDSFLGTFQQPPGMDDATYQKFLFNSAKNMQAGGNFYAFEAMKRAGLLKSGGPLDDGQIARLETGYDAAANKALGDAAHDPKAIAMREALDADIKLGRIKAPMEASARLEDINAYLARKTGITGARLYDPQAVVSVGTAVTDAALAAARRIEDRQWQIADREDGQQFQLDKEAAERAQKTAAASNFFANGQTKTGIATGLAEEKDANVQFGNALQSGNYAAVAKNFDRETYKNDYAASVMQSGVKASIGVGLTGGFQHSHEQWDALNKASPAAAAAYMGEYAAPMEAYDNAIKRGDTALAAYAQTFGNPAAFEHVNLPTGTKLSDANSAITGAIQADDKYALGLLGSRTPLNDSSTQRLSGWLLPRAADYARTAGISIEAAAAKLYKGGLASGEIERAGPLGWANPHAAAPLAKILRQPDERVDEAVTAVADAKLKAAGVAEGIKAPNIIVMRLADRNGVAGLYISTMSNDGSGHKDVPLNSAELKAWLNNKASAAVAGNQTHTGPLFPARP